MIAYPAVGRATPCTARWRSSRALKQGANHADRCNKRRITRFRIRKLDLWPHVAHRLGSSGRYTHRTLLQGVCLDRDPKVSVTQ